TQQAQRQTTVIEKRPAGGADGSSSSQAAGIAKQTTKPGPPKVLSISGDTPASKAKVLSIGGDAAAPKAKVLSSGGVTSESASSSAGEKKDIPSSVEAGAKMTAAKAIDRTEKANDSSKISSVPSSGRSSPSGADGKPTTSRAADTVEKEQTADVDLETLEEVYGKEHVNLIFIGHVDAGKSTLGGRILVETGMVDERT